MLHKRGNIYHVKFKAGGVTYQRSAQTPSIREAEKFERNYRAEVARELSSLRSGKKRDYTFGEALDKWQKEGAPASMESHANNAGLYLDNIPLRVVVPAAHQMKADMLKRGLSPQTINRRLAVVRRVLNVAYKEWDWLAEPLGTKIKLLSEKGLSREIYLSEAEVKAVMGKMDNMEARKVMLLAAYTGLRQGEILKLKPSNWIKPYIYLDSKTKGGKARTVPVIKELHKSMTLPFELTYDELRGQWERAREAIGRPEIRFHDLRHTFASWLAKDPSIPLTMLRDLLGHSNLSVTSKYSHLRGDTMSAVSAVLKGKGVAKGVAVRNTSKVVEGDKQA